MKKEQEKIKICENHTKRVPLIWTFAFIGAEFWCPYCGYVGGMFGSGKTVNLTPTLEKELEKWEAKSKAYLHARAMQVCHKTKFNGEYIDPKDLPESEKLKNQQAIENWKYQYKE